MIIFSYINKTMPSILTTLTIIDLREEHELKQIHLKSISQDVRVINIPTRHIKFNLHYIEQLAKTGKVGLMCHSGNRSLKIKRKFFKSNRDIISIKTGITNIQDHKLFDKMKMNVIKTHSMFHFGIQQYMQMMFIGILLISSFLKNKMLRSTHTPVKGIG
mgnify:FL=1